LHNADWSLFDSLFGVFAGAIFAFFRPSGPTFFSLMLFWLCWRLEEEIELIAYCDLPTCCMYVRSVRLICATATMTPGYARVLEVDDVRYAMRVFRLNARAVVLPALREMFVVMCISVFTSPKALLRIFKPTQQHYTPLHHTKHNNC